MNNQNSRWIRLGISVFALLLAGIIYAWSFLKAPFADLFGWDPRGAQLQLNYTLTLCFFCIGGLLSGIAAKWLSTKVRMLIGGALVAAGFGIVSTLDGTSAFMLYLGYGCMAGLGIGIVYNVIISSTGAWFPDKKGIASGSMMLGFGFSAMVLGNLATALFDSAMGWRGTFVAYGVGIGACLALCGLVIRAPKAGEVPQSAVKAAGGDAVNFDTKAMLKRPSFWMLFAFCTILGAVGSTAIGQAKDYMKFIDADAVALATLGASMISVMNGAGRLIAGTMFDKIGMRKTQVFNSCLLVLAPVTMLAALLMKSAVLGFIGLCLCGFAFSFAPTVTATFVLAFFGRKHFPTNFPVLTLTLIPASFAATLAGSMTFTATYVLLVGIAVIGAVLNLFIKKA